MPSDLADEVRQELDRKSLTPEEAVQKALDDIARDIAIIEPDPEDWVGWVKYLLEQMEMEAGRRIKEGEFKLMLSTLRKMIHSHFE